MTSSHQSHQQALADLDAQIAALDAPDSDHAAEISRLEKALTQTRRETKAATDAVKPALADSEVMAADLRLRWRALWALGEAWDQVRAAFQEREQRVRLELDGKRQALAQRRNGLLAAKRDVQAAAEAEETAEAAKIEELQRLLAKAGVRVGR